MPLRLATPPLIALVVLLAACGGDAAGRLSASDLENATYLAEFPDAGEATLDGGEYRYPVAEGSAAEAVIRLERWSIGDIDGDGAADAAAITSERPGGSGTFYFVHAVLNASGAPRDRGFAFLGDRVRVESVAVLDGVLVVALYDRPETASYSEEPSIAVIRRFRLEGGALTELPAPASGGNSGDDATDATDASQISADDLKNATYLAEGPDAGEATLDGGEYRYPVAEGSAAEAVIRLERWSIGDIDGDGAADAAAITSERPGGSGTFYFVHAVLNDSGAPRDRAFAFLGDRVRVESVAVHDGVIVVALYDRPETASYSEEPTVAVIRRFRLEGGALTELPAPASQRQSSEGGGNTLQTVIERGVLLCGVKDSQPGFGYANPDGSFSGFDVEFCKAIAAAVLGDANKVVFVPTSAAARFELLATGQIDVLIRTTTVTAERDAGRAVDFGPVIFYTGQGFAVQADLPYNSTADMDGASICMQAGTTTERNLDNHFNELGYTYTPLPADYVETQHAFVAGRCEVWTADLTSLASRIWGLPNASDFRVLGQLISREPLAPGVRDNDSEWKDIVSWVVSGLINAELLGVSQGNVTDMAYNPPNDAIARLLGLPFEGREVVDLGFGVDPQFIQRALMAVGNYGDIYERTLAPIGIDRACTLNALYTEDKRGCPPGAGGILYAPPYR